MAGINSTEVSYGFGQMGSIFQDTTGATTPPVGKCIVAITFLDDTKFTALVAQTKMNVDGTVSGDEYGKALDTSMGLEFPGTAAAAHNLTAGNETAISGAGGQQIASGDTFPKGLTIFGRWISFTLASGSCIAYLGDAE
tara:strand:- start:820 stop:1236 length:417 start_codon:yes stop_codon:yes gene_type:complete